MTFLVALLFASITTVWLFFPELSSQANLYSLHIQKFFHKPENECEFVDKLAENLSVQDFLFLNFSDKKRVLPAARKRYGFLPSGESFILKKDKDVIVRYSGILLDLAREDVPFYRLIFNIKVSKQKDQFILSEVKLDPTCDYLKLNEFHSIADSSNTSDQIKQNHICLNLLKQANEYRKLNDVFNAKKNLHRSLEHNPSFWPSHYLLHFATEATSANELAKVIQIRPDYSRAYFARAINEQFSPKSKSFDDFTKAIELEPSCARAWQERAKWQKTEKDGLADLDKALELHPYNVLLYGKRAEYFRWKGKTKEAINEYSKGIALVPDWTDAHFHRGFLKAETGDYKGAIEDYSYSIEHPQTENDFYLCQRHYLRGKACAEIGKYKEAIADFEKAAIYDSTRPDAKIAKAEVLFDSGNEKEALRTWLETQNVDHSPLIPIKRISFEEILSQQSEKNQKQYREAIATPLKNAKAYSARAEARWNAGDGKGALADINMSLSLDKKNADYYSQRSKFKSYSGDYTGALKDITKAISIQPNNIQALHSRAGLLRGMKDFAGSARDLKLARAICKKIHSRKEILTLPILHEIYYGFGPTSGEYDHISSICYKPGWRGDWIDHF